MTLDLPTLVLVLMLVSLTLAVSVLYVAWTARAQDGLATWGWGLVLHALSYPAFLLRLAGWPVLSILTFNALTAGSLALMVLALERFQRHRGPSVPRWLIWGPVPAVELASLLLLHEHQWRAFVISGLFTLVATVLAWQAWRPGPAGVRERGRFLLLAGSGLLALLVMARVVFAALLPDWDNAMMVPPLVQGLTYYASVAVLLLNTMGFVLMQKEWAVEQQAQEATHDPLTGAANRRALNAELDRTLARAARTGQPVALLMVDIDWFKRVNDAWGHQAGDAVLAELVRRLQGRLRHYDLLARFGGEEFVALLPDTALEGARAVAEDLRRTVAATPFAVLGHEITVTVSVGVADLRPEVEAGAADLLLGASDRALYRAKQNGRNRVEVADVLVE